MKELKRYLVGDVEVRVVVGDITVMDVDAVVNAANSSLLGGGGVDGAIHRAGGGEILEECRKIRKERYPDGLPTGEAVSTTAGRMLARYVLHTVGPVWRGGGNDEDALLKSAYEKTLALAEELGIESLAYPAISTGVYGFPRERASSIVHRFIEEMISRSNIKSVSFVFFSQDDALLFLDYS